MSIGDTSAAAGTTEVSDLTTTVEEQVNKEWHHFNVQSNDFILPRGEEKRSRPNRRQFVMGVEKG